MEKRRVARGIGGALLGLGSVAFVGGIAESNQIKGELFTADPVDLPAVNHTSDRLVTELRIVEDTEWTGLGVSLIGGGALAVEGLVGFWYTRQRELEQQANLD